MPESIPGLAIGRIVIYGDNVAIISKVIDPVAGLVNLHVLVDDGENPVELYRHIPMRTEDMPAHASAWHWPPRV